MEINGHFNIVPTKEMIKSHGLGIGGPVQKFIDSEMIRCMSKYTPMRNGALEKAVTIGTVIGSGTLSYISPYARFQYEGKVMTTEDGRVWAKRGEKKPVVTNRDLNYDKTHHPLACSHWFDRAKADCKEDILRGAQEVANKS